MASNINPFNIDGAFPVAGQNNSSQGFRDNFTSIRNNLAIAKTEIEDIQAKALLKSALTGTTLDNSMSNSPIVGAQLRGVSDTLVDHGFIIGTLTLDYNAGNVHKVQTTGDITLSFASSWPTAVHAHILLWITVTYKLVNNKIVPYTLALPNSVNKGIDRIDNLDPATNIIRFDVPGDYVFEFSSIDSGQSILIKDWVGNKKSFNDPSFYYNPNNTNYTNAKETFFIGFGNNLPLSQTLTSNTNKLDAVKVFGSQTNYAGVGDHGNDVAPYGIGTDGNAAVAGFSVGTSRAKIDPVSGLPDVTIANASVHSNDYIGYFNFTATTRNPQALSNMTVCEFGSIRSFVTGGNTQTPGGNIWIGTKSDGGHITPAMSVENDQSVFFQSNVMLSSLYSSSSLQTSAYWPNDGSGNFKNNAPGRAGQMAWSRNSTNVFFYICYNDNQWMKFTGSTT